MWQACAKRRLLTVRYSLQHCWSVLFNGGGIYKAVHLNFAVFGSPSSYITDDMWRPINDPKHVSLTKQQTRETIHSFFKFIGQFEILSSLCTLPRWLPSLGGTEAHLATNTGMYIKKSTKMSLFSASVTPWNIVSLICLKKQIKTKHSQSHFVTQNNWLKC